MERWLLVGDVHGNQMHTEQVFYRARALKADRIVQLGDFGYGFDVDIDGKCKFTKWCSRKVEEFGVPLYFLGGNHENWDMLEVWDQRTTAPKELSPGVFYVPRATMHTVTGVRVLFCGGAASVDWEYRKRHQKLTGKKVWWPQEGISKADVDRCAALGHAHILLTHDFPWECTVVDRHLSDYWGVVAEERTKCNRRRVSQILANCGASKVYHGHLHRDYLEMIHDANGHDVIVQGLNCDNTPLWACAQLITLPEEQQPGGNDNAV
jgi:predicted phosphodiesterase